MTQRPHAFASGMQSPQQALKPELQAMPQLVPSQVALPFAGSVAAGFFPANALRERQDLFSRTGGVHAAQSAPQLVVLSFGEQKEPHTWVPSGHSPSQGVPAGMHVVPQTS